MSNVSKTDNYSFRLTPSLKLDLMKRAAELGKQPGEYITNLIELELASKNDELPVYEQKFIAKQFQVFADKLLSFMVETVDKKLNKIEQHSIRADVNSSNGIYQASQAAVFSKEIFANLTNNDPVRMKAATGKNEERNKAIHKHITERYEKEKVEINK